MCAKQVKRPCQVFRFALAFSSLAILSALSTIINKYEKKEDCEQSKEDPLKLFLDIVHCFFSRTTHAYCLDVSVEVEKTEKPFGLSEYATGLATAYVGPPGIFETRRDL